MRAFKHISALPPVAVPVAWRVLLKAIWMGPEKRASHRKGMDHLIRADFDSQALFWVSSGRAALFILLSILMDDGLKREVVLPAYTCPTVLYAIRRAGLEPKFCDIDPANLGLHTQKLVGVTSKKTLAVVAHHLFGIPCNIEDIVRLGNDSGIPIIEDVAQGLGAEVNGKKCGCFGDLAFFSLGKGKVITSDHGGAILVKSKIYLDGLNGIVPVLSSQPFLDKVRSMINLALYPVILRSFIWWFIERTSWNPESRTIPESNEVRRLSDFHVTFASLVYQAVDAIHEVRIRNGTYLMQELGRMHHVSLPQIPDHHQPVFLRFPVLFKDIPVRDRVYQKLSRMGFGVSRMGPYQSTVDAALSQGDFPNARFVSQSILTLPTHYLVKREHLDAILSVIDDFG